MRFLFIFLFFGALSISGYGAHAQTPCQDDPSDPVCQEIINNGGGTYTVNADGSLTNTTPSDDDDWTDDLESDAAGWLEDGSGLAGDVGSAFDGASALVGGASDLVGDLSSGLSALQNELNFAVKAAKLKANVAAKVTAQCNKIFDAAMTWYQKVKDMIMAQIGAIPYVPVKIVDRITKQLVKQADKLVIAQVSNACSALVNAAMASIPIPNSLNLGAALPGLGPLNQVSAGLEGLAGDLGDAAQTAYEASEDAQDAADDLNEEDDPDET